MKTKILLNVIGSFVFSFASYIFGGIDSAFIILLIIMALDYITGICKAIYKKELNSFIGVKGIIKKFGYLLIVALAVLIDKLIGDSGIRSLVIYFFIANEGISILENWGMMGLPLPKKIYDVLEQLKPSREKSNKNE